MLLDLLTLSLGGGAQECIFLHFYNIDDDNGQPGLGPTGLDQLFLEQVEEWALLGFQSGEGSLPPSVPVFHQYFELYSRRTPSRPSDHVNPEYT